MTGSQETLFCSQALHMYIRKETSETPIFCPITQPLGMGLNQRQLLPDGGCSPLSLLTLAPTSPEQVTPCADCFAEGPPSPHQAGRLESCTNSSVTFSFF